MQKYKAAWRPLMDTCARFTSSIEIYLLGNSYLTEVLDAPSIRCLTYALQLAKRPGEHSRVTYKDIRENADISCNNYVQRALKTLQDAKLVEVSVVKKTQSIRILQLPPRIGAKAA